MLSRISANAVRATAARRAAPAAVRCYAQGVNESFNKREQAQESEYARKHEQEALKKLREQIEKKKQELADLEKEHAEKAK